MILVHILITALAVLAASYLLPGVQVPDFMTAIVMAIVLGLVNAFLKPILVFLTLPINIVTLGLFLIVINALLVLLAAYFTPGVTIDGFLWAIAFSIVVSIVTTLLNQLV